jgi:holo-[acyl-carrier protein] synthase
MPISGIGIDLIEIERLERALERRPRLGKRLFTAGEREYASSRARPGQHLAARFCAKEAVAKSLGLGGWSFTDVEVVAGVPPVVRLTGRAKRRADDLGVRVQVSLTHDRVTAAAVACADGADE